MLKYPLIKFTVPFLIGIVLDHLLNPEPVPLLVLGTLCVSTIIILVLFRKSESLFTIVLIYSSILLAGIAYNSAFNINSVRYPFAETKIKNAVVYGRIKEIKLKQGINYKFVMATDSVRVGRMTKSLSVILLVRIFPKEDNSKIYSELEPGNVVKVSGTIKKGRTKRNPGEYDYQQYLESIDVSALLDNYDNDIEIINSDSYLIAGAIHTLRKKIDETIAKYHNRDTAGLLRGLLLADRGMIDYELKESFVNAGVVHVLAVSGLHVGYIILIFLVLFNRANIIYRYIFTIIGLIFFLLITGSPPSVFRATVMAIILLLTNLSTRKYNAVNTLFLAALILLILNPNELFMPGFQLSFSAVLSILIVFPMIRKSIDFYFPEKGALKYILLFLGVTLSAQVGTLPFTLYYFGKLSLISFIANLIVIPLIGIIVANGILTLFIAVFSSTIASIYASANEMLVYLMNHYIILLGTSGFSHFNILHFSLYDAVLFYICIFLFFYVRKYSVSTKYSIVISLILFAFYSLCEKIDNEKLLPNDNLSIVMIDVGQGDSFFIKFPDGKIALIDGGEADEYFDNGQRVIIPLLDYLSETRINYGFLTHLDSDHLNGYLSVIKEVPIDTLFKPLDRNDFPKDKKLEKLLDAKGIPVKYYHKQMLKIGGCSLYILNDTNYVHYNAFDVNNKSGVFKLVFGKNSFIFSGDAEKEVEQYLVETYGDFLKSDVLKAGHHGSKTSSIQKYIDKVNPEYALISAGEHNRFNHPSKSVLEKLQEKNILIFRTDKMGAVILCSDGKNIRKIDWE